MALRMIVLVVAIAACGRLGFDPRSDASDGVVGFDVIPQISGRHWVDRLDGTPGALLQPQLAYVPGHGVVLYGGSLDGETVMPPAMPLAAMWQLDPTGWTSICDPCAPGKRVGHSLAYDPKRSRLVLIGGTDETAAFRTDTWEWDGTTWQQVFPTDSPVGHYGAGLAYDPSREKLVLIGGMRSTTIVTADVYEYDGTTWTQPVPTGGPSAVTCFGQCATYDPIIGHIVTLADDGPLQPGRDEAWAWDGTTWTPVCTACTGTPRDAAELIFDPATRSEYLINGFDPIQNLSIAGTWQSTASPWPQVSTSPALRDSSGVAYDPARNVIVLYGGNGAACGMTGNHNCSATLELVPD